MALVQDCWETIIAGNNTDIALTVQRTTADSSRQPFFTMFCESTQEKHRFKQKSLAAFLEVK